MLVELEYKNLINNFSSQKVRKINFNWKKFVSQIKLILLYL